MKNKIILLTLLLVITIIPFSLAIFTGGADISDSNKFTGGADISDSNKVTLVTGDTVIISEFNGQKQFVIEPADPTKLGQNFQIITIKNNTYVIPNDINLNKIDIEFFNIDYLMENEYGKEKTLPMIISYLDLKTLGANIDKTESKIKNLGGEVKVISEEISLKAAKIPKDKLKEIMPTLVKQDNIKKIWLDKKYHITLAESVPLIGAPELWDAGISGTDITVAVIDTGIDYTHQDLGGCFGVGCKVIGGYDFVNDDNDPMDDMGHGTHVAGIIAANGILKGVAPNAKLLSYKVCDSGGWCLESDIVDGIAQAWSDNADIISMSLGGIGNPDDFMSMVIDLIAERGVVSVIAAGNSGSGSETINSPGTARKAITVGASDKDDIIAYFSSRGPVIWEDVNGITQYLIKPDIVAPGVSICSAQYDSAWNSYKCYDDKHVAISGTSMATPHVAGGAALLLDANPIIPLGWSKTKYIKNLLISTADDLGYDVYTQGGGRIYLPSAFNTEILVDPVTISFGLYTENTIDNATLTFYNLNTKSSRTLNLNASIYDVLTGIHTNAATLNTTTLIIPPNSNASVLLTINTSVPKSTYSGKVVAYSGGAAVGAGEAIHAIFGFVKMNKININKVDMMGGPAIYDYVTIFNENLTYQDYGFTNENGTVTFYVPDGVYHVVSTGVDYGTDFSIVTIKEGVPIFDNSSIILDERDTIPIKLDTNKQAQTIAEKTVELSYQKCYDFDGWGYCETRVIFSDIWYYPKTTLTYISPTSFDSKFTYAYYPQEYVKPTNPNVIDTLEWHKLFFELTNITEDTTFVANYTNLVKRTTDYKVGKTPTTGAYWYQFANGGWTFGWKINAPQSRIEWLSPNVYYFGEYEKYIDKPGYETPDWEYYIISKNYPPKSEPYLAVGEHPFASSIMFYIWNGLDSNYLYMYGSIFTDTFENEFGNWYRYPAGNLTIIKNGEVILDHISISDSFYEGVYFNNAPKFEVIIEGNSGQDLSTYTKTILKFVGNSSRDYNPPKVMARAINSNLYNIIPGGKVEIEVKAEYESPPYSMSLEYSIDDGKTWKSALTSVCGFGVCMGISCTQTCTYNLGTFSDKFISLRVNATDNINNSVSQTIIRGIYVAPTEYIICPTNRSFVKRFIPDYELFPNISINTSLDVVVKDATYYAVDESPPSFWNIINPGTGDTSQPGHIKWVVISGATNTTYQYTVKAPNESGTYYFDGTYMFEGDIEEQPICEENQVTICRCYRADINCDGCLSMPELMTDIGKWKHGEISMSNLMKSICYWKHGCHNWQNNCPFVCSS